jgi:2-polyprenyl-3-methyl-5-hydroxy-6-metoxy-1,4-benzoquinol methylase
MKKHIQHNIEVTKRVVYNQTSKSLDKMKSKRYNNIINVVTLHCDKILPLLDVGARKGELLDMFNENGFNNLYALEIWSGGVEIMKEKGYIIIDGDAESFSSHNKFGTVVMSHVLEHCYKPKTVLENVYNALMIGGVVYVEVPTQKEGGAPMSAGHYSFFPNLNSLISIFDSNNWDLIDKSKNGKNIWVLLRRK